MIVYVCMGANTWFIQHIHGCRVNPSLVANNLAGFEVAWRTSQQFLVTDVAWGGKKTWYRGENPNRPQMNGNEW